MLPPLLPPLFPEDELPEFPLLPVFEPVFVFPDAELPELELLPEEELPLDVDAFPLPDGLFP